MRLLNALYAISKVFGWDFWYLKKLNKNQSVHRISIIVSSLLLSNKAIYYRFIFCSLKNNQKITMKYFVLCALFAVALAGQHHGGGGGQPQELVVHVSGGGGGASHSHAGAQSHAAAGPARK